MKKGRGIHAIDDIRQRCHIRADEDCWEWRGSVDKRGVARAWFPAFDQVSGMGPIIAFLRTGKRPKKAIWIRTCNTDSCANPEHWGPSSRKQLSAMKPRKNPELHRLRVIQGRRLNAKITAEDAASIRTKSENWRVYANRFDLSRSSIMRIQAGKSWLPIVASNSIFGLAASMEAA